MDHDPLARAVLARLADTHGKDTPLGSFARSVLSDGASLRAAADNPWHGEALGQAYAEAAKAQAAPSPDARAEIERAARSLAEATGSAGANDATSPLFPAMTRCGTIADDGLGTLAHSTAARRPVVDLPGRRRLRRRGLVIGPEPWRAGADHCHLPAARPEPGGQHQHRPQPRWPGSAVGADRRGHSCVAAVVLRAPERVGHQRPTLPNR